MVIANPHGEVEIIPVDGGPMRHLADWLLVLPVPDPELQCELIGWAMMLIWLADAMVRWSAVDGHLRAARQVKFLPANDNDQ